MSSINLLEVSAMKQTRNCSLVLLGDSYTTFAGHIPEGNWTYYPRADVPEVTDAEMTWWRLLIHARALRLLCNESSSGTTLSTRVRPEHTPKDAFISRMKRVLGPEGVQGEKPELILILGGTNDSWIGNEAGELQFEGWSDESLKETLPAACYMLDYITRHNPNAAILFILNSDLRPEIAEGLVDACAHYGVALVRLADISKQCGHPDAEGMKQIAAQVGRALDAL